MKSIIELARGGVRDLKPCVHGGEVWEIRRKHAFLREDLLDFSANINPAGPSPRVIDEIKKGFWQIPFYPESDSITLREAIAQYIKNIDSNNVIVGNGSTELIHLFVEVFIDEGDEALIPVPTFGEYEVAVRRAGGRPRHVKSDQALIINPENLLKKIGSMTKAIFLCNPNNPTGALITPEDLLGIVEAAAGENVLVFLDEDFMDFVGEEEHFSLKGKVLSHKNLFILRSLTKVFGLAGLRIGYGIACEEMIDLLLKVKIPWNVNCLGQLGALAALKDKEYLEKTRKLVKTERMFLSNELKRIRGLKVFPSHANFILINVRESGFTAPQLKRKMLRHGILIRDCSSFKGLDKFHIRVAVRTRQQNLRLLEALREVVGGLHT
ncbi:MAG: threonine-phosphate decarboxylase CobD [Candidatus Geothermarchaeales archaeon]